MVGNDAANNDGGIELGIGKRLDHCGSERHMAGVVHRQANGIGIFLLGGSHDAVGGLTQSEVNDLHACISQNSSNHLDATVVPVEAKLGQDYADLGLVAQMIAFST